MTIITKIIEDLNVTLADFDAANAAKAREWAKGRVAAVKAYRDTHCTMRLRGDEEKTVVSSHELYQSMFTIAGGKTWYGVFHGRNEAMINEFMDKNSAAIVAKRNALIAKKLAGFEVTAVTDKGVTFHDGGVDCTMTLETDKGRKFVEIDTIVAGGYNIQCLHNRTLVKVR